MPRTPSYTKPEIDALKAIHKAQGMDYPKATERYGKDLVDRLARRGLLWKPSNRIYVTAAGIDAFWGK